MFGATENGNGLPVSIPGTDITAFPICQEFLVSADPYCEPAKGDRPAACVMTQQRRYTEWAVVGGIGLVVGIAVGALVL